ncbi:ferritin-like superfamily [Mycena galopus ATCC 62051]|nr:ferritin-like superfamily [Mycena galopus ATCC 62051]
MAYISRIALYVHKLFGVICKLQLLNDRHRLTSPESADENLNELRKKFVGDITLLEGEEPLLKELCSHFVLFPIIALAEHFSPRHPLDMANVQESQSFFLHLSKDLHDWNDKLNGDERHFSSHVLAFFTASDGIVNENLLDHFSNEEPTERDFLFDAIETIPCIKKKAEWALRWMGLPSASGWSPLQWSRRRPHPGTVHRVITEALKIEQEFLTDALPVSLIGMNTKLMCQYIEFVANCHLVALGNDKV